MSYPQQYLAYVTNPIFRYYLVNVTQGCKRLSMSKRGNISFPKIGTAVQMNLCDSLEGTVGHSLRNDSYPYYCSNIITV